MYLLEHPATGAHSVLELYREPWSVKYSELQIRRQSIAAYSGPAKMMKCTVWYSGNEKSMQNIQPLYSTNVTYFPQVGNIDWHNGLMDIIIQFIWSDWLTSNFHFIILQLIIEIPLWFILKCMETIYFVTLIFTREEKWSPFVNNVFTSFYTCSEDGLSSSAPQDRFDIRANRFITVFSNFCLRTSVYSTILWAFIYLPNFCSTSPMTDFLTRVNSA